MPTMEAVDRKIVSHQEWLDARKAFLLREKEFTHAREAMAQQLRELPWERVEKECVFEGENGRVTLSDLFAGRSQLVVYHFMFAPDWEAGCDGCSLTADHLDGPNYHLRHHDVTLLCVSRAPFEKLAEYKRRMDWRFPWYSSHGSDFNYDYGVSFLKDQVDAKGMPYNYTTITDPRYFTEELPGLSVFVKDDDGAIYHTYSTYARGLDTILGVNHLLDLTPRGRRDKDAEGKLVDWVKRHDEYEHAAAEADCCHESEARS